LVDDSYKYGSMNMITIKGGVMYLYSFWVFHMSNDSMSPKDTTFHHLTYVARWSPTTFWVFVIFKNKLR
jgi:hypothetical protein